MRLLSRILSMSDPAWGYLMWILRLSCVMALCAFAFAIKAPFSVHTYENLLMARELSSAPAALLFIAAIATAVIDEAAGN